MPLFFTPNGLLDIATDPADLPGQVTPPSTVVSGSMQRCKNLRLDQQGQVKTRDGSDKINSTALAQTGIHHVREQAGTRYTFSGTVIYEDETSIATGLTDNQWSSILYNAYNDTTDNVFALNGTDRKRIEGSTAYEWGHAAPSTKPTISAGSEGGLTGAYNFKYTYCRLSGSTVIYESAPSDAADLSITCASDSLLFKIDPEDMGSTSTLNGMTHYRVYRTLTGGSTYYLEATLNARTGHYGMQDGYTHTWENTSSHTATDDVKFTTTGGASSSTDERCFDWEEDYTQSVDTETTDSNTVITHGYDFISFDSATADGSVGAEVATNHDRPPLGSFVAGPNYNGTCFIAKDNLLYYCLAKQPEYWPTSYYVEVSPPQFPIQCVIFSNGQPYALTKQRIYYIQGTGPNTFFPLAMESITGAQGPQGALAVQGKGIYHVGTDGIYLFAGHDRNITQDHFRPIFRGTTTNGVPGVDSSKLTRCWLIQFQNRLYFGYASSDDTYPEHCLVLNLDNDRWSYYTWGIEIRTVTVDEQNRRLLAGTNDGFIWELEKSTVTDDDTTQISWDVQSKDYTLQTRRHFPRYIKYDVDASDSNCSATGSLMLDGSAHQSHTITGNRTTKRRLVATGNGRRASIRINGSGPVSIYAAEAE